MRKLYFKLCRLIGYRIMTLDYWDPETFTFVTKNSHIVLYKYIGNFKHDGSMRLKEIYKIQIKKI